MCFLGPVIAPPSKGFVLIIDSDPKIRGTTQSIIGGLGYSSEAYSYNNNILEGLNGPPYDVVICGYHLVDTSNLTIKGPTLCRMIFQKYLEKNYLAPHFVIMDRFPVIDLKIGPNRIARMLHPPPNKANLERALRSS